MKKRLFLCGSVAVFLAILQVPAQPGQGDHPKAWLHGFGAVGATTPGSGSRGFVHFGGGGEALLRGGLGFGAELGVLSLTSGGFGETALGVFSPGLLYSFRRDRKTAPFVTGGYSLFFRSATAQGAFIGGGVNYWMKKKLGWRFEVRDNMILEGADAPHHFVEGRVAILFR